MISAVQDAALPYASMVTVRHYFPSIPADLDESGLRELDRMLERRQQARASGRDPAEL